jgi:putative spermidine/putrescine transport system ATP-binding protein
MSQGTHIRLEHCGKTFDDGTRALEPLDLHIDGGETVVFLGPSGCGKTTTLRLIAGLERPDPGGRVLFDNDDVTPLPIEKRHVGMVFQSYALFPNMTVAENVSYGLRIRGMERAEREARTAEMLAMMHIENLAQRRIDRLSGGQKQRVALARALAVRPRVLLLDEPLTALDAKLREVLRVEIDALLRRVGITTIYVTHDQAEAMALGDRIVVMTHGQVAQTGTPRDIYLRPANRFVADFIGAMNCLRGTMSNGYFRINGGGRLPWPTGQSSPPTPFPHTGERSEQSPEIEVLFRPESVRVVESAAEAHVSGLIAAAFFIGDRTRLIVEGVGESPLVVECGNTRVFKSGEPVHLALDSGGLRIFNREIAA